jgi:hypothetical protein
MTQELKQLHILDNAALCLRDYLISSGVAFTSEIDDTLFSTAANICDETVTIDDASVEKVGA